MRPVLLLVSASLLLAACQTGEGGCGGVTGACQRTETVRYNRHDYKVSFIYSRSSQSHDVSVHRHDRPMKSDASDRNDAIQIAISTVSYYACPQGYRARVLESSFRNGRWSVSARCVSTG